MIIYLDTSALIKLYVEEEGSATVKKIIKEASVAATSRVSFAEARSALARCWYEKALSKDDYHQCIINLKTDWETYFVLDVSESVVQLAGDLTERYMIRGFDGIHLASGLVLIRQVNDTVAFACWDGRLWDAANKEGFKMVPDKI